MTKEKLLDMINDEIANLAINKLTKKPELEQPKSVETAHMTEDDFDEIVFSKKEKYEKPTYTIREAVQEIPKITNSEVREFENEVESFSSTNGASIVFDTQRNGYSLSIHKKPDGIEAYASGVFNFGMDGKVYWTFSLINGLNIGTENLQIEKNNKEFVSELYNFFDGWQKKWRERLSNSNKDGI